MNVGMKRGLAAIIFLVFPAPVMVQAQVSAYERQGISCA